jgi:hypothetical protein
MKKLLAGLTVLLTASFTGCFAAHGFDSAAVTAPATQAELRRRRRSSFADRQRCHVRAVPRRRLTTTPSRQIRRVSTDVT